MIERSGKHYLTVREFAQKAGISNQAVYKQIKNQLSTYVSIVDNRKMIDAVALFEVYGIEVDNRIDNRVDNHEFNNQAAAAAEDPEKGQADVSKELLEMLKEEIQKKDQQIEKLQEKLDKAYMQISEMAQKAQYITAADKTERIMMQQPKGEILEPAAAESSIDNGDQEEQQPKKSFWQRLFGL